MPSASRKVAFVLLAAIAIVATGCGSNNTGKIEGKWKMISMPGEGAAMPKPDDKAFIYFEFLTDGTVNLGLGASEIKDSSLVISSGKYRLLNGDNVEFTGLADEKKGGVFGKSGGKDRLKVKITGDDMTITGSDGVAKLARVK